MIFNADTPGDRLTLSRALEARIKAPYTHVEISTLGGVSRASALITVSLDPKSTWFNRILHNSRYFMIHLNHDGVMEQFAGSYRLRKKLRKTRVKSLVDAVAKINKYIAEVK